ncbi:MAG: hypothetical protein GY705_19005 [Bacteroidetes bacterium]|nr:hypothetical protein [Bacteroidota bacterium]
MTTKTNPPYSPNLSKTCFFIVAMFGILGILPYAIANSSDAIPFTKSLSIGLLLSISFLLAGAFIGFLFGIPRTLQEKTKKKNDLDQDSYASNYRVNTNLEEISDWLTKIIVGVGLTQLSNIPELLRKVIKYFSSNLGVPSNEGTILLVIVYYFIGGFFLGYLLTRMYLAIAFSHADIEKERLNGIKRQVQDDLDTLGGDTDEEPDDESELTELKPVTENEERKINELDRRIKELTAMGVSLDSAVYHSIARQLLRIKEYKQAANALMEAFNLEKESIKFLNSAAIIRSKHLQDYDGAENLYRFALSLKPAYTTAIYNMACNETRRGNFDEAMKHLKRAIKRDKQKYLELAKTDDALEPLRGREDFKELVKSV